jgi:hypothetical protein
MGNLRDSKVETDEPITDEPPSYDASVSSPEQVTSPRLVPIAPPILNRSSSSFLRGPGPTKKKNVAYKPSKEQQKQLDVLDNGSVTALTAVSSHSQTEYFDILPSFQMFQSILKRDDNQFNENLLVNPPVYGDMTNSSPSPSTTVSPTISNSPTIDETVSGLTNAIDEYQLNQQPIDENFNFDETNAEEHNRNVEVTENTYGHSPLDNIDRLPHSRSSPLDIQIYVTKRVPVPNATNELETRLKEYTSGDLVNGYIIITNTSSKPVDFGLFTVSLEGTIKATERNLHATTLDAHKYNKILMQKFLKMYDFNASYGYTHVPNSSGIEYVAFTTDESDGTILGLPDNRSLLPNTKYKKFFTFKFPHRLLDNTCLQGLLPHILPPPSMGLDSTCFYNRGETLELNKALGYGFLNIRGTPLMTKDYAFDNVSISYTIEAKFIDKRNDKNQKTAISHDNVNEPNAENEYEISKSNQYFLRFIPDLKEQYEYCNRCLSFENENYQSTGIDGKFMDQFLQLKTWRSINEWNYTIEKEIDNKLSRQGLNLEELKAKSLYTMNNTLTNKSIQKLNVKDQIYNQLNREYDDHYIYQQQRMLGNKIPVPIYGKKKKMFLSTPINIGTLDLYVKIPDRVIEYSAPKLLMKYNNPIKVNGLSEDLGLSPVLSHMSELYNRDNDDLIQALDLDLLFTPIDSSIKPPNIASVDVNIVFWSYNTEYPLPFEVGNDFLYTNIDEEDKLNDDSVEITRKNIQHLKDRAFNYISFLQSNDIEVSKKSYLYLNSIKSLGIKKDTIQDYFKSYTAANNPDLNSESSWHAHQVPSKKMKWTKKLSIPLTVTNKNNINLLPSFQSCLVGRSYCLQVVVKFKGHDESHANEVKVDIPILVG